MKTIKNNKLLLVIAIIYYGLNSFAGNQLNQNIWIGQLERLENTNQLTMLFDSDISNMGTVGDTFIIYKSNNNYSSPLNEIQEDINNRHNNKLAKVIYTEKNNNIKYFKVIRDYTLTLNGSLLKKYVEYMYFALIEKEITIASVNLGPYTIPIPPMGAFDGLADSYNNLSICFGISEFDNETDYQNLSVYTYDGQNIDDWIIDAGRDIVATVGDFDGNGIKDILVTNNEKRKIAIFTVKNFGGLYKFKILWQGNYNTTYGQWLFNENNKFLFESNDIDNDGKDEIFIAGDNKFGILKLTENTFANVLVDESQQNFGGHVYISSYIHNSNTYSYSNSGLVINLDFFTRLKFIANLFSNQYNKKNEIVYMSPNDGRLSILHVSDGRLLYNHGMIFNTEIQTTSGEKIKFDEDSKLIDVLDFNGDGIYEMLLENKTNIAVIGLTDNYEFYVLAYLDKNIYMNNGWKLNLIKDCCGRSKIDYHITKSIVVNGSHKGDCIILNFNNSVYGNNQNSAILMFNNNAVYDGKPYKMECIYQTDRDIVSYIQDKNFDNELNLFYTVAKWNFTNEIIKIKYIDYNDIYDPVSLHTTEKYIYYWNPINNQKNMVGSTKKLSIGHFKNTTQDYSLVIPQAAPFDILVTNCTCD